MQPKLIAIVGGSCSGKTLLASQLIRHFGACASHISLDDYYKDLSHIPPEERDKHNFDEPTAIDWDLFINSLEAIVAGKEILLPVYDFKTHTRLSKNRKWKPTPIVIVDGLWLLWDAQLRKYFAYSIFIHSEEALRLSRRISRDITERGRSPEFVKAQFMNHVAPMHNKYVEPQGNYATVKINSPWSDTDLNRVITDIQAMLK